MIKKSSAFSTSLIMFGLLLHLIFDIPLRVQAQVAWVSPADPGMDDSITVFFDAAAGNGALKDFKGDVYLHTGAITSRSLDGHDWKYVVGEWGKPDGRVLMKRVEKDKYAFGMLIRDFYKLRPEDSVRQLAFVFRNADGTLVGKTAENEDINVNVNGYRPPQKEMPGQNRELRKLIKLTQGEEDWLLETDKGRIWLKPYNDNIISASYLPGMRYLPDSSHAVILEPSKVKMSTLKLARGYRLQSGAITIFVNASPLRLSYVFNGDTLLREESGFFQKSENNGLRFKLAKSEKIYGTGERALPLDRRGNRLALYNRPFYNYEMGAGMLNYSVPLIISSKKYALLWDNPQKGYVDIGKAEDDVMEWQAIGGTPRYFVIAAKSYPELMGQYTGLTGRQALPPRWAMGNLQSRMAYRNQKETEHIVKMMQDKDFPIDAIIIDFYWFGDSILGHLGRLDWYKPSWPDPDAMISKFSETGVKTILITEPYIIDTMPTFPEAAQMGILATDRLGKPYINHQFYFGPGALMDIFKPSARDWFWEKYQRQIKKGVAGWWGDLGEPESHPSDLFHVNGMADQVHNIYGHYWDRMLFEKYAQHYPRTRLFHLQRSGFAGSQRYSAFPWTGDVARSWGGLQAQLPLLLTMGMNGLGYIHSDAGGFAQGVKDEELYARWLQFAVFTPILRPHGSGIPSEPVFFHDSIQDIVRKYIKLRYAMLPYNYTLAWQNAVTGEPLMRPMFYYASKDKTAIDLMDQYYWGENMLVAPVLEKNATGRKVYLPEGMWYDFVTAKKYNGKSWVSCPLTLKEIPVFVKAGSFIPLIKPINNTSEYHSAEFVVRYYPYGATSFVQYEDDGKDNLALKEGNFELIRYSGKQQKKRTDITLSREGSWDGIPERRVMTFEVRTDIKPKSVVINGKAIPMTQILQSRQPSIPYAEHLGQWLRIKFPWFGEEMKIGILY